MNNKLCNVYGECPYARVCVLWHVQGYTYKSMYMYVWMWVVWIRKHAIHQYADIHYIYTSICVSTLMQTFILLKSLKYPQFFSFIIMRLKSFLFQRECINKSQDCTTQKGFLNNIQFLKYSYTVCRI